MPRKQHKLNLRNSPAKRIDSDLLTQWEEALATTSDDETFAVIVAETAEPSEPANLTSVEEPITETNISAYEEPAPFVENPATAMEDLCSAVREPSGQEPQATAKDIDNDVIMIGEYRIQLAIPKDILKQVKSFNRESANKSAGFWAAQIIKKNPQLTRAAHNDPVHIWNEIKDNILKKIAL